MAEMSLAGLAEKLGQTWPARLAKDAYKAVTLPGDVYQGNVSMYGDDGRTNPEVINRSMDLAGLMTGGSYAAPAMKDASGMGIRAYHGSPHDFDRFDLSKIGTGEGAQSYGHGLYFAENEAVARDYRNRLGGFNTTVGPHAANWAGDIQKALPHISNMGAVSASQALKSVEKGADINRIIARKEALLSSRAPHEIKNEQDALQALKWARDTGLVSTPTGKMYEVNINADPAHFLDWDKPLRAQPQHRDVLTQIAKDRERIAPAAQDMYRIFNDPKREEALTRITGKHFYENMSRRRGDVTVSPVLNERGIPGIKYLDQGSRGAGTGSSNYVVFNPDTIEIMKKYGLAGMGSAAGLGAMAGQQEQGF